MSDDERGLIMEDYKPNSHLSRERQKQNPPEKKKIEKVVKGKVKAKKKNEVRKLADVFISEDAANVKSYILMDVLIPAIKKAVSDIVTNGIDMILYGEAGHSKKRSLASTVSYSKYYDEPKRRDYPAARTRTGYNYDDIILESRSEAEEVLDRMSEMIDQYGMVSVADLYDLVGISGNYTDNKYGWTNIRNAEPIRVKDGYLLKLPKVLPLD